MIVLKGIGNSSECIITKLTISLYQSAVWARAHFFICMSENIFPNRSA